MRLTLGNKNYSSWSMRGWLAARAFDIPFETTTIWLGDRGALQSKLDVSPAGRVPILQDGDLTVWDSMAIGEYLAEKFPDRGHWPADPGDRARARSLAAEMHSGFTMLREQLPMNVRAHKPMGDWRAATSTVDPNAHPGAVPAGVAEEVTRVAEIWGEARGPFLFGEFCLADAFFAPIASRFKTYGIELWGPAATYAHALLRHPAVVEWCELALAEEHAMPGYD